MKSYIQKAAQIRYRKRRAKRALQSRIRFKKYLRQKNFEGGSYQHGTTRRYRQFRSPTLPFTFVNAPAILSLLRNPEEMAKFIARIQQCFDKKKPVFVILKHVEQIDYDGITVLLSVMVRFKAKKILFNGDKPDDKEVLAILEASGFFDFLSKGQFREKDDYVLTGTGAIHTHGMRDVDPEFGARVIESASRKVWGKKRRCTGVQRVLLELMQNTNNHASPHTEGEKHWWLTVKHNKELHRVAFAFVDYGVGVFHSLRHKPQGNKFFGIYDRLKERCINGTEAQILNLIFLGELHRTATGHYYRGKGLPGVYSAFKKNKISNLAMITNRAFYNSETDEYRMLNNEFQGTFIYWELTQGNHSHEN